MAVVALVAASACFSEDPDPMEPGARAPAECLQLARDAGFDPDAQGVRVVGMRGFAFVPAEITVDSGTRVVWVNCEPPNTGGGDHTTTSDEGVWDSGSPFMSRGDTFDRVFDQAGVFPYHCIPHASFMVGTVTVQ